MNSTACEIAQLQEQMHQVRMDLGEEVHDLVENARAMTDWHVHWRRHPLAFGAAAVLLGYLIVPSRRFSASDSRILENMGMVQPPRRSVGSQLLSKLAGMAVGLAAQKGIEIAGRQIEGFMASRDARGNGRGEFAETNQHDYE